jgi:hypothetical protein
MKTILLLSLFSLAGCAVSPVDPSYGLTGIGSVLFPDTLRVTLTRTFHDGHDPACKALSSSVHVTANGATMNLTSAGGPHDDIIVIACDAATFELDATRLPHTDGDALRIEVADDTASESATFPQGLTVRTAKWTKDPQPNVRGALTLSPDTDQWVSGTLTFSDALLDTYEFTTDFPDHGHNSQYKGDATIDLQGPTLGFLQASDHTQQLPGTADAWSAENATECTLPDGCALQHHVTQLTP